MNMGTQMNEMLDDGTRPIVPVELRKIDPDRLAYFTGYARLWHLLPEHKRGTRIRGRGGRATLCACEEDFMGEFGATTEVFASRALLAAAPGIERLLTSRKTGSWEKAREEAKRAYGFSTAKNWKPGNTDGLHHKSIRSR